MRHFITCSLLGLVCVTTTTGCISDRATDQIAEAVLSKVVAPPIELSFAVNEFRRVNKRWPQNYQELSAFVNQSKAGMPLRQYDQIDFTEKADGNLEIYAVAPGLTNRMTLTWKVTDQEWRQPIS